MEPESGQRSATSLDREHTSSVDHSHIQPSSQTRTTTSGLTRDTPLANNSTVVASGEVNGILSNTSPLSKAHSLQDEPGQLSGHDDDSQPATEAARERGSSTNKSPHVQFQNSTERPAAIRRPGEEICDDCIQLGIRIDKFRVKSHAPQRGRDISSRAVVSSHQYVGQLKTSSTKINLGTLQSVHEKRDICPVCALIWSSVAESAKELRRPDDWASAACSANWELDGRGMKTDSSGTISESNNLTRRIHLRWTTKGLEDSYIVLVTPMRYVRPNSDAPKSWGAEHLFLARPLEKLGKNQALINSWVTSCEQGHGERCQIRHDKKFSDLVESSFFGVIDVRDLKLDRLSEGEPYAALSYVWGKGKKFTTTLDNVLLHRNHGGIEANLHKLPNAIVDAIEVCRRLHIRYLWVDSLCIVQNSKRSWRLNAAAMDIIYGNAHLTICAADGIDASAGLTAIRNGPKPDGHQLIKEYQGLRLTITKLAETGMQKSEWNKRAWTFCERMLSKRCLIFTQGHVYFQCRSTAMSEDIVAEPQGAGWSLGLVDAPLQLLHELKPNKRPFWVYTQCVELYTKRQLTHSNDILHAFAGMANLLSERMGSQMLFGLPNSHFDLALLWVPTGPARLRQPRTEEDQKRWGEDEFPTWSWCGWEPAEKSPNASAEYNANMIDGCMRNVNDWLSKHTWIHWYIRDGYGDLRAVFQADGDATTDRDENHAAGNAFDGPVYGQSPVPNSRGSPSPVREWARSRAGSPSRSRQMPIIEYRHAEYEPPRRSEVLIRNSRMEEEQRRKMGFEAMNELQHSKYYARKEGYATTRAGLNRDPEYGRQLHSDILRAFAYMGQDSFNKTTPEHPFNVNKAAPSSKPSVEFPDQRYLQFWTWSAWLRVLPHDGVDTKVAPGMARFDIADDTGDWVGTIVLEEDWMTPSEHRKPNQQYEFLALSEAKGFTEQENPVWTYYIPTERNQSQWDLFFVMMVERGRGGVAKRVGLGKVFQASFDNACYPGKEWKEIILK